MGKVAELHKIDERLIDMHSISAEVARAHPKSDITEKFNTWAAMTRCLSAIRLHLAQEQSLH